MSIKSVILYTTASHEFRVPQVRYIAKGLRQAGFETTVAGPLGPTCVNELQELGVSISLKPISPRVKQLKLALIARLLDTAMDGGSRYDLALGIGSSGVILAALACRLGRAKHLGGYFIEYDPPECYRGQMKHYPHHLVSKFATKLDLLIDVNKERLERRRAWMHVPELAGVLLNVPQKSFVREMPLSAEESLSGPLKFLYQGTLGYANGLKPLFESFRLVDPELYTLTLAGHSSNPEALNQQIAEFFPAGNVKYSGLLPRTELPDFVSRHHVGIALYPWRNDPMNPGFELCAPNKLYEYLARGLPVVCSDNVSLEFVDERKLGWRIDPDNPQQLTSLIDKLCRERQMVYEYGRNALALSCEQWNFEHEFKAIADLIKML